MLARPLTDSGRGDRTESGPYRPLEWVWTGQKSPPLDCAKCVWAQGGVGTPVPKETPEVSPVTASKAGSWPCAYLWLQTVQASRCHSNFSNHSLSDDAVYAFKDCSWRCVIWMLHDYANQNYDHADLCASCQDFQAPTGRRTGGILCSLWRTLPKILKNHQKPDAILQKWSNMWNTCTAAVPLSLVQNVPAQLPPRKKGVISSSALSALMTWFVEHVLRLRTNESVQWHFTILVFLSARKLKFTTSWKRSWWGMMFFGFFSKVHTKTTHPFYREDVDNPLAPRKQRSLTRASRALAFRS